MDRHEAQDAVDAAKQFMTHYQRFCTRTLSAMKDSSAIDDYETSLLDIEEMLEGLINGMTQETI